jgi:hypothetical protein
MSKTVSLNTAIAVVKSAEKLPAPPPKREYGDFDRFVAKVDELCQLVARVHAATERLDFNARFNWIEQPDHICIDLEQTKKQITSAKYAIDYARNVLSQFPSAHKRLAKVRRDVKWYDRSELYDIKGKGKRERKMLSRRVVSEQIALLLASFPNTRPGTPEAFGKMMIEEVYANSPDACAFESACRQVRRGLNFPPSIAELLKAIDEASDAWCERWSLLIEYPADQDQQELENAIAEAESIIAKADAKYAEREAREKAAEEKRKAYREAYERIPKEERWAYEHGQRDRAYNQSGYGYKQGPQRFAKEYMDEGREAEAAAYFAGCDGKQIPGLELKTNGAADGV